MKTVAFTIFLSLFLAQNSAKKPDRNDTQGQTQADSSRETPVTVNCNESTGTVADNKRKETPERDTSVQWSNWFLVGVAAITGFVIWIQAKETAKATKAARESIDLTHRPKLAVRNVVIPALEVLHRQTSTEDLLRTDVDLGRLQGYFQLVNTGNTLAVIESIQDGTIVGLRLPMERKYANTRNVSIQLAAGESRKIDLTPLDIPTETQGAIMSVTTEVYVVALITYRDRVGNRREAAFCRRLDRSLQRLVPTGDTDYEYTD